jgi:3-oxoacyl-[acyl-carrier-protein] synthase II
MRSVGITGVGLVTPIGNDPQTVWNHVRTGKSGITAVTKVDVSDISCKVAGVTDFEPAQHFKESLCRRFSRSQTLLLRAVELALEKQPLPTSRRVGVVIAVGGGFFPDLGTEMAGYAARKWRAFDRTWPLRALPNMAAGLVSKHFSLTGPSLVVSSACASSADAIALASRMVRSGEVDIAIAAGSEAWITQMSIGAFSLLGVLSRRPGEQADKASRPFDQARDGFVPSEGAGAVVIEPLDRPGGTPLCEIVACASSNDAFDYIAPAPNGEGLEWCIREVLRDSGLSAADIGLFCVHATSTVVGDIAESRAISRVAGPDNATTGVYAPKALIGHTSAASGVIETVIAAQILANRFLPPQCNLDNPDPECAIAGFAQAGRGGSFEFAIKTSSGFGGHNTALLIRRAS